MLAAGAAFFAPRSAGPAAMVIDGDAGMGKTTISRALVDRAKEAGWTVLSSQPAASDAALTLSGLDDLLDSLDSSFLDELPRRPPGTSAAGGRRRAAPQVTSPDGVEPRLLGIAVRSLLGRAAGRGPVLVAVEDLQWVDPASATVLGYVMRRLRGEPVGILASHRTGEPVHLDIAGLLGPEATTRVRVTSLSVGALHHVVADRSAPRSRAPSSCGSTQHPPEPPCSRSRSRGCSWRKGSRQ